MFGEVYPEHMKNHFKLPKQSRNTGPILITVNFCIELYIRDFLVKFCVCYQKLSTYLAVDNKHKWEKVANLGINVTSTKAGVKLFACDQTQIVLMMKLFDQSVCTNQNQSPKSHGTLKHHILPSRLFCMDVLLM